MTDRAEAGSMPLRGVTWDFGRWARTSVFVVFALHIWLAPFAWQILDVRTGLFRSWTMFSGVGVGILKGEFRAVAPDGTEERLTPLQVLGLERYPVKLSIHFPLRVMEQSDLRKFAASFCENRDVKLSFDGLVGSRQGWKALHAEDICAWPHHEQD